ncbi:histidine kinase dimerization/phospho-acceptor domain-containing protein, partial [Vibrio parahaemolyticus]
HEIRTPLARMRLLVELGKSEGQGAGPLDEIDREIVDIDNLVAELLAASRIDFSALSPRDLDLRELAQQA